MFTATPTILVVDDDAGTRGVLEEFLAPCGYHVLQASNGAEALRVIGEAHVDVVLTDLVMPDRDGIEIMLEIQRQFPSIRTIAMSGAYCGQFLKVAQVLGARATLSKPINSRLLRLTVLQVLADPS